MKILPDGQENDGSRDRNKSYAAAPVNFSDHVSDEVIQDNLKKFCKEQLGLSLIVERKSDREEIDSRPIINIRADKDMPRNPGPR